MIRDLAADRSDLVKVALHDSVVWILLVLLFEYHEKCLFPAMDQHLLTKVFN